MATELTVIAISLLAALGLIVWAVSRRLERGEKESQARLDTLRAELAASISSSQRLVATQLGQLTSQVNDQLSTVALQMQASTGQMNQRMDGAARTAGELREKLGELSKAAERIFDVGRDISSLQDILRSPKLRGGFGEYLLADILSQSLPQSRFTLQYTFATGARVDAVVRLKDGLLSIDAKFPLENFRRLSSAPPDERKAARKKFSMDCKRHIEAIATSYILPHEGTLDFALMYIPSEGVYHETILKDDETGEERSIAEYAFSRRVIPVSPNTFYAYLQTILMGLKGAEMGDKAREIFGQIEALKTDFTRLTDDLEVLGRHLANAGTKFDEVQKKAGKVAGRLEAFGVEDADKERPDSDTKEFV